MRQGRPDQLQVCEEVKPEAPLIYLKDAGCKCKIAG
jgi:hypothetical protein